MMCFVCLYDNTFAYTYHIHSDTSYSGPSPSVWSFKNLNTLLVRTYSEPYATAYETAYEIIT